jgi:FSR family fosmidomycin resistance protein-like MFS transporter
MNSARNVLAASVAHASNHLFQLLLPTVLPLVVTEFGLTNFSAGLLLAYFSLPYAFFQLVFGEASDRIGRKTLVVMGTLASSAAILATSLSRDLTQLILLQVVAGIASAAYHPAGIPLVSESSGSGRRGRALGLHQMGGAVGSLAPPLIAGAVASALGWRGVMAVASAIGFSATAFSFMALDDTIKSDGKRKSSTLLVALRTKPVLMLLGASLTSMIAYRGIAAFTSLYIVDGRGRPVEEAAVYYSILQAAGVIGGPIGGAVSDRFGRRNTMMAFVIVESSPLFLLPVLGPMPLAAGFAVIGLGSFAVLAVQDTYLSEVAPPHALGSAYGLLLTSSFLPSAFVPPAMGAFIDSSGFDASFALIALATLVSVPMALLVDRAARERS